MKVFIFGAGASVASQQGTVISADAQAPLVDNLFDHPYHSRAIELGFPVSDLEEYLGVVTSGVSLEKFLTDRWNLIQGRKTQQFRESERKRFGKLTFYIWWLMQTVSRTYNETNGYRIFLKKLLAKDDDDFGIISFNYDTLLDRAIESEMAHSFITFDSYRIAKYVKIHGSVNWFIKRRPTDPQLPLGEQQMDYRIRYGHASTHLFNENLNASNVIVLPPSHPDLIRPEIITSNRFNGQYFYPLVLLPLTSKLYEFVISYRDLVIWRGMELLQKANEIYFIGYRAVDEVIKEMFQNVDTQNKLVHIHVVSQGDASEIMERVLNFKVGAKKGLVYNNGFSQFVADHFK